MPHGWIQVNSAGNTGWVTRRYVTVVLPDVPDEDTTGTEIPSAVVGTWNLEWFKDGKSRGFPEDGQGGPSYGSRTNEDFQQIADVIQTRIGARIMILEGINGQTGTTDSVEMNRLIGIFGNSRTYELASSSGSQCVGILYNQQRGS